MKTVTIFFGVMLCVGGQLKTANAAITPNGIHEENEQIVNEVFLETVAVGVDTFSAQQATDLFAVSVQCPSCGGDAVFRARSLYAIHDSEVRFSDPNPCNTSRSADQASVSRVASGFAIYPNPAIDQVTISLGANLEGNTRELVVQSITGNVVFREALPTEAAKHFVNTSSFSAGAYLFVVFEAGEKLHTEKIFIIK